MPTQKRLWTREELILTLNLYLKLPFGKLHKGHPEVQELAKIINRSANSVALRLVNFAACDPYLKERGIRGMIGGVKQDQLIWDEFSNDKDGIIFESEQILAKYQNITIDKKFNIKNTEKTNNMGCDKIYSIKKRVNQTIFRQIILSNYNNKCAIAGIDIPDLLVASHIIPWAINARERLNPTNGICLSSLYDRTFDIGLIGIAQDYRVKLSCNIK